MCMYCKSMIAWILEIFFEKYTNNHNSQGIILTNDSLLNA